MIPERPDTPDERYDGLAVQRRCPRCGGPIDHRDTDRMVGCEFCGIRLAILDSDREPAMAVPAEPRPLEWILEAKRALRALGRRLKELQHPYILYAPFYRVQARLWQSWTVPPASGETVDGFDPNVAEHRWRIASWEQTLDAVPSLNLGDRTLGARSQVCPLIPLEETARSSEAPARLAVETPASKAREILLANLRYSARRTGADPATGYLCTPRLQLQRLYHPYVVIPYRGLGELEAVVLDGITGRLRRILDPEELRRLETGLEARPGEEGAWRLEGSLRLVPLSCRECSAPLPWAPRAAVHRCAVCGRCWLPGESGLTEVPWRGFRGVRPNAPRREQVHLPFYLAGGMFLPAFHGRHPRAAWSFALGLSGVEREWEETDVPVHGAEPGAAACGALGNTITEDVPVETTPGEAAELLGFARHLSGLSNRTIPGEIGQASPELIWVCFEDAGREWIEPGSGLVIAKQALSPWEMQPRSAWPRAAAGA